VCNTSGTIDPSKIWGETTDLALTGLSFAGSIYNICGFLGASQNKPAGLYTDTVTVSVSF
jgi:spore coat protein U-like protein